MTLGTTDISTTTVGNAIGNSSHQVSVLCTSSTINKWSKFKPVQGTWPQASDGKYGYNISNGWTYSAPTSTFRLGDFRGYEHSQALAFPPLQCRSSEATVRTVYPVAPEPGVSPYANYWKIRWYQSASSVRLTLADMGMSGYYYGVKISINGGTPWYKTYGQVTGSDSDATFNIDCSLRDDAGYYYYDLPYGSGTYSYVLFVSSSQHSTWTQTTPSNYATLPADTFNGIGIITSGSFTVAGWVKLSDTSYSFTTTGGLNADTSTVTFLGGGVWSVQSKPDWITVQGWDYSGTPFQLTNSSLWYSGTRVRLEASQNYSSYRSGSVVISANGATANISVEQQAAAVGVIYVWAVGNQESFTISNYTHGMSVGSTSFNLAFDHTFVGDSYKPWSISKSGYGTLASGSGNPGGIRLRTGIQGTKAGTLSQAIADGDTIYIMIGLNSED